MPWSGNQLISTCLLYARSRAWTYTIRKFRKRTDSRGPFDFFFVRNRIVRKSVGDIAVSLAFYGLNYHAGACSIGKSLAARKKVQRKTVCRMKRRYITAGGTEVDSKSVAKSARFTGRFSKI